jgi:DNA-binding transcriptional LysR family regulator
MAQPPLSQQIRRLETLVGHALIERSNSGPLRARLTPAGEGLLEHARRALLAATHGLDSARRGGTGESGRLTLGFVATSVVPVVAPLLRWQRDQHPEIQFAVQEMTTQRQWHALNEHEIDVGIAREVGDLEHSQQLVVESLELLRERLVAVVPSDHPLAAIQRLPPQALKGHPFILVPRQAGPAFVDALLAVPRRAGFEPKVVLQPTEWASVCGLVAGGLGISIMPESAAMPPNGAVVRPLTDRQASTSVSAWWLRESGSPTLLRFVKSMRTAKQQGQSLVEQ